MSQQQPKLQRRETKYPQMPKFIPRTDGEEEEKLPEPDRKWLEMLPGPPLCMLFNRVPGHGSKDPISYEKIPVFEEVDPYDVSRKESGTDSSFKPSFGNHPLGSEKFNGPKDEKLVREDIWSTFEKWSFPARTDGPRGIINGPFHPNNIRRRAMEKVEESMRLNPAQRREKVFELELKIEAAKCRLAQGQIDYTYEVRRYYEPFEYDIREKHHRRVKRLIPIIRRTPEPEASTCTLAVEEAQGLSSSSSIDNKKQRTEGWVTVGFKEDQKQTQSDERKSRIKLCASSQMKYGAR